MTGMSATDADAFLGAAPTASPGARLVPSPFTADATPVTAAPASTGAAPGRAASGGMTASDADMFLGPEPVQSVDDFGRTFTAPRIPTSTPERDQDLANSAVGRTLGAFGQGLADGWGTGKLGLSDETVDWLKKGGLFPEISNNQSLVVRAVNEGLMRPAAAALTAAITSVAVPGAQVADAALRGMSALFSGAQAGVVQGATEAGQPKLGEDLAELPNALQMLLPVHGAQELSQARELGVIGEPPAVWAGFRDPVHPPLQRFQEDITDAPAPTRAAPAAESFTPHTGQNERNARI